MNAQATGLRRSCIARTEENRVSPAASRHQGAVFVV
jgi:hypothetical protein